MSDQQKATVLERILAYSSITIIVIAVASFLTTLVVALAAGPKALEQGLWQIVAAISYIALPIGFLLLITLLIINFRRRGKEKQ